MTKGEKTSVSPTLLFMAAALAVVAVMATVQVVLFNSREKVGATASEAASMKARIAELEMANRQLRGEIHDLQNLPQPGQTGPSEAEPRTSAKAPADHESVTEEDKLLRAAAMFYYFKERVKSGQPFHEQLEVMAELADGYPTILRALTPLEAKSKSGIKAFTALRLHRKERTAKNLKPEQTNTTEEREDEAGEPSAWRPIRSYLSSLVRVGAQPPPHKDGGSADGLTPEEKAEKQRMEILEAHRRTAKKVRAQLRAVEEAMGEAMFGQSTGRQL